MSGPYRIGIPTRWMDTDAYGHVNNVEYYSFFDTAVTTWLVEEGGVDPGRDATIGLCVESMCTFSAPLGFPETVTAELRAGKVGHSSVRYEIVLYGGAGERVASGYFVHVHVDRKSRSPVPIPSHVREKLDGLQGTDRASREISPTAPRKAVGGVNQRRGI